MDEYKKVFAINTEFFSTYSPHMIEEALANHIRNQLEIEPIITKNKYKIKFSVIDSDEKKPATEMFIRILKVSDEKVCVEFQKISGDYFMFLENYNKIKNALNLYNDTINEYE